MTYISPERSPDAVLYVAIPAAVFLAGLTLRGLASLRKKQCEHPNAKVIVTHGARIWHCPDCGLHRTIKN